MYDLLVMTFDSREAAEGAREAIRQLQREKLLRVEDAAVLQSDADGGVSVDNEISRDTKIGAGVGAILGALFTLFAPVLGVALGAASGALVGASLERGVDPQFVDEVKASLAPNTSALFLVVSHGNMDALRAALSPYGGRLLQTTLDEGVAQQLRDANQG